MKSLKNTKKKIYLLMIFTIIFIFRYTLYSMISDTRVAGYKYIGFSVEGNETNGFEYLVFNFGYMALKSDKKGQWKSCTQLNKNIESYLTKIIKKNTGRDEFLYVSEVEQNKYKAYLKFKKKVIFIRGFPDLGGSSPSEDEKNICD